MDRYEPHFLTFEGMQMQVLVEYPRPAQRSPEIMIPTHPLGIELGFTPRNRHRFAKALGERVISAFNVHSVAR